MDSNSGNPREVLGTPHCRILDIIVEDILNHRSDSTYDIVYIPYHETKYIYRFTCPEFTSISKDRDYLRRCILQARFECRRPRDPSDPSANKFKEPQPFQLTALPRNWEKLKMNTINSIVCSAVFSALSDDVVASPLANNSSTTIEQQ